MTALLVLARFTLLEAVSRRLILAGLVLSLLFLGLFALGFGFLHGRLLEDAAARPGSRGNAQMLGVFGSLMTLLGLYAVNFLSGFLALFLSVGAISGEIEAGTLHALLARPIRRADLVLGRWLAYAALVTVYVAAMAGSLLLLAYLIAGFQAPDPARAISLMVLASLSLLSLSLLGSSLVPTLANGVVAFSLFGLAWLAGIIEFIGNALSNLAMVNLGIAISLLVPSDATWRVASYYVQSPSLLAATSSGGPGLPFFSSVPPTTALVAWALLYPLVLVAGAVLAFNRRDL